MTIKDMRAKSGMTQKAFSDYLNIPKRTIEDWENDRRKAPDYVVEIIEYKLTHEGVLL